MKITGAVFDELKAACAIVDTEYRREVYRRGAFPRADKVVDLNVRYRWDVFYAAQGYHIFPPGNDFTHKHIDTALKRIVPPL